LQPHPIAQLGLLGKRQSIAGSAIGGIKATQELIDFCAEKNIYPDCKIMEAGDLDQIWDTLAKGDGDGLRYVLDIKKSLKN